MDCASKAGDWLLDHPEVIAIAAVAILAAPVELPIGVVASVEIVGQVEGVLATGQSVYHAAEICNSEGNTSTACLETAAAAGVDLATLRAGAAVAEALSARRIKTLKPDQVKRLIEAQIEVGSAGVAALLDKIACG